MNMSPTLRLLVFGLPGSGKSSLLGALLQAAGAQAAVLKGRIADDTGRLTALRRSVYADAPPAPDGEVSAYPVRFIPDADAGHPLAATLLDCDGRLAQQYLTGRRPLSAGDSTLARAMLEADTVILTLDASATPAEVGTELATFQRFLTALQEVRGRRAEVADLPVYLVLTKCDRLARPEDTFSKWQQRLEEAKRRLAERFAAFLADDAPSPAFGSIDLNLWATAIHRPALGDRPAQPEEPYGVAELFRQCLASAEGFDRRARHAGRRLEFAVAGLGFLVVMLGLLAGLLAATQPDTELIRLQEQVQAVLPEADAPADRRLRGPLKERLQQLDRIRDDPAFAKLPAPMQQAVARSRGEIASYLEASTALHEAVKHPYQAKNEAEFERYETQARDFALPPSYAAAWADTRLARQLAEVRREYAAVRAAVTDEVRWVHGQIDEGKKLYEEGNAVVPELTALDPARQKEGRRKAEAWKAAYLRYMDRPYLRFSGDRPVAGAVSFTYADLRKFEAVRRARQEWEDVKGQLDKTFKYIATIPAR